MQKTILILIGLILLGCGYRPPSKGDLNVVHLFCSEVDRPHVEPAIDSLFAGFISTPQPEKIFKIVWKNPEDMDDLQLSPNLMVISIRKPKDDTGDRLYDRFVENIPDAGPVISLDDVYAKNQSVIVIKAEDAIDFQINIDNYGDWILTELERSFDKRLLEYVLSKGLNQKLMKQVKNQFGLDMKIQEDFTIIRENADKDFLWLGRGFPYRWLVFNKIHPDKLKNPEESWVTVKEILEANVDGITIQEVMQTNELIDRLDSQVRVLRGLYFHEESQTGGPFFTYLVDGNKSESVRLISGFVNYPGHDKILLLKQLEILALTYQITK